MLIRLASVNGVELKERMLERGSWLLTLEESKVPFVLWRWNSCSVDNTDNSSQSCDRLESNHIDVDTFSECEWGGTQGTNVTQIAVG